MTTQAIPDRMRRRQMPDVISARVPTGFGDQVREAARAEGLSTGALIRAAISECIERVGGASPMTDDQTNAIAFFAGDDAGSLVGRIERAETDEEFRADLERRIAAYRFSHADKILTAYTLIGEYLEQQAGMKPDLVVPADEGLASMATLQAAYSEIDAARGLERDLGRLVARGMEG